MFRNLPPLGTLRAFEAAARLASFAKAAEELHVTRGAISQQIRVLEDSLGRSLFRRKHRGIALNVTGQKYYSTVSTLLEGLDIASGSLRKRTRSNLLRIRTLPALAEKWIMPRLGRFCDERPLGAQSSELKIELSADDGAVDFGDKDADMWLTYSDGNHEGHNTEFLMDECLFPVCSPQIAKSIKRPSDLVRFPLLRDTYCPDDWEIWLKSAGIENAGSLSGHSFSLFSMVIQAAVRGLGICMAHGVLVQGEIETGALVEPLRLRVPAPASYFMVTQRAAGPSPAARRFSRWLVAEAKGSRSRSAG